MMPCDRVVLRIPRSPLWGSLGMTLREHGWHLKAPSTLSFHARQNGERGILEACLTSIAAEAWSSEAE